MPATVGLIVLAHPIVRVHAMRMLADMSTWNADQRQMALAGLKDADAVVQRCAADAMGQQQHRAAEARQAVSKSAW